MTTTRHLVLLLAIVALTAIPALGAAETIPTPAWLVAKGLSPTSSPTATADAFLGTPYRADGTLDEQGRNTLFEHPYRFFPTPGLNCSGLVVSLSRFLLGRNIPLVQASRDRLGDSGPQAALGQDWDFGWDLIWNVAEFGTGPRLLLPDTTGFAKADGTTQRGFAVSDVKAWATAIAAMRPGTMVLGSVSKLTAGGPRHHHVVLILPLGNGRARLYHATPNSGTHSLEIGTKAGLGAFIAEMERGGTKKMILLVETGLPVRR